MTYSKFLVVYSTDALDLYFPLHVDRLVVHLGNPGPAVDVGAHDFTWTELETIGVGSFTLLRNGQPYVTISRSMPELRTPVART